MTHHAISTSQASVRIKLEKLEEGNQQGRRESMISTQTADSLSTEERVTWRTIRKELEKVGIDGAAFEANQDFILSWLSRAVEAGTIKAHNGLNLVAEPIQDLPAASTGSITDPESNASDVGASTELCRYTEHHSRDTGANTELPRRPKPETLIAPTTCPPDILRESSTPLKLPSCTLPIPPEPFVSCERCGKSNIAYELHMRCQQCIDGNYNLCLHCWRLGRGCLNWYGFGQSAVARWNRTVSSNAGDSTELLYPHILTGRRYRRVIAQEPRADERVGAVVVKTSDPDVDLQIQTGFFCASCSAYAQDIFWVCEICNDGEWGYCGFCVSRGRCCTHPLLHVGSHSSTNVDSMSSMDSQPSETTPQRSPLICSINCSICASCIPPTANHFHCPQCDDDLCASCYLKLVKCGKISRANGPQGWRRCLKNHRMVVVGFEISDTGQRYIVVQDLVGGHALDLSNTSPAGGTYPPSGGGGLRMLAQWSFWPSEGEGDDDELAFPKGAEIRECENVNDDWFWGFYCGRQGLFPRYYCKDVTE